jgi:hypothetical protein
VSCIRSDFEGGDGWSSRGAYEIVSIRSDMDWLCWSKENLTPHAVRQPVFWDRRTLSSIESPRSSRLGLRVGLIAGSHAARRHTPPLVGWPNLPSSGSRIETRLWLVSLDRHPNDLETTLWRARHGMLISLKGFLFWASPLASLPSYVSDFLIFLTT